ERRRGMRSMSPKDLERSPTNPALSATFEGNYSPSKEDGLAKGSFRTGFESAGFDEARNERRRGMRSMSPKDLERSPTNPALSAIKLKNRNEYRRIDLLPDKPLSGI
ncbi:MAG: hypothetical protein ACKVGW_03950, partial [Verrucomicrobiia bacterium]